MHNDDYKILQILDQSACLSKSQLTGYLNRSLYPEELRVVELHLSGCKLCSDALEGFEAVQNAESLISSITPPVLPEVILPEKPVEKKEPIQVNPPANTHTRRSKHPVKPSASDENHFLKDKNNKSKNGFLKTMTGIAAGTIIGIGVIWFYNYESKKQEALNYQAALENNAADTTPVALGDAGEYERMHEDSLKMVAEKRMKDSIYFATMKAEKLKQQKDSLANAIVANKTDTTVPDNTKALVAANGKEQPDTPPQPVNAKKQSAASDAVAMASKKKEESKAEKSDFELGMEQYKQNNFASALLYFKTAESDNKNPKHWEAVYLSGMCNKSLDRKKKAIKYFERVVAAKVPQAKAAQKQLDNLNSDK